MRWSWLGVASVVSGLFVSGACGGRAHSDDGLDVDLRSLFVANHIRRQNQAYCEGLNRCCIQEGHRTNYYAGCMAMAERQLEHLNAAFIEYDLEAARDCTRLIRESLADCSYSRAELLELDRCSRAFRGLRQLGETCHSSWECSYDYGEALYCKREEDDPDGPGRCEPALSYVGPRGALGDPCSQDCDDRHGHEQDWNCATSEIGAAATCYASDGLYCDTSLPEPQCAPLPTEGEPCTTLCADGLFCNRQTQLCEPRRTSGDCLESPDACVESAYCSAEGFCEPKKPDRAPCEIIEGMDDGCENFCVSDPDPFNSNSCGNIWYVEGYCEVDE